MSADDQAKIVNGDADSMVLILESICKSSNRPDLPHGRQEPLYVKKTKAFHAEDEEPKGFVNLTSNPSFFRRKR